MCYLQERDTAGAVSKVIRRTLHEATSTLDVHFSLAVYSVTLKLASDFEKCWRGKLEQCALWVT